MISYKFKIPGTLISLNEYIEAERSSAAAGARIKKQQTNRVMIYAVHGQNLSKKKPVFKSPVIIDILWVCQDRRKDKDNISFAKKFVWDGIVNAGFIKADGWNDICGFFDDFKVAENKNDIGVYVEIRGEKND